jgi:hypothetical protein
MRARLSGNILLISSQIAVGRLKRRSRGNWLPPILYATNGLEVRWNNDQETPHAVGRGYVYREVLDHVIILNERHLRRVLPSYLRCGRRWQTPLALLMGCPHPRPIQRLGVGKVMAVLEVGGLHHHDERRAAS